jgi:hypothetical protein
MVGDRSCRPSRIDLFYGLLVARPIAGSWTRFRPSQQLLGMMGRSWESPSWVGSIPTFHGMIGRVLFGLLSPFA